MTSVLAERTPFTRPSRDEELRLEAEARTTGGPNAFRRWCQSCDAFGTPIDHDVNTTPRQSCPHCGHEFPTALNWRTVEADGFLWLVLRQGDVGQAMKIEPGMDVGHKWRRLALGFDRPKVGATR